jgi:hypothetical protein
VSADGESVRPQASAVCRKEEKMSRESEKAEKTVLCGANAYEKKYYFNEKFAGLPESVKDELHIICVLFTEEIGGIFTIAFETDGSVSMSTEYAPEDYLYDEVGSGLLVNEVRRRRQELFESLSLYYRVLILHEDVGDLLGEDE